MRLNPLILKPDYWKDIEYTINLIFWDVFYAPIKDMLESNRMQFINSIDLLIDAIRAGKIFWEGGEFKGEFNARISKELLNLGGTFNARKKVWTVPAGQLPPAVSMSLAEADYQFKKTNRDLMKTIDEMPARADKIIADAPIAEEYEKTLSKMDEAYLKTLKSVTIAPKLTNASRKQISEEWATNLKLYIKDFTDKNILELREEVEANVMNGGRANGLTKTIQKNYNVSKDKAKFLARQETSLLMSKFREKRYSEIGVLKYMWSGVEDERERPDHKLLEGKIFSWENPPVTNRKTGATNHPGEDFNCRCVAIPIME